jgi:hypothetical protein
LIEGEHHAGDVVELQAEMCSAKYAEFELLVPMHPQLHFFAYTREPVQYIDGEYLQRILVHLQPMSKGDFELDGIVATVAHAGTLSEVELPSLKLTVASYAVEDISHETAELSVLSDDLAQPVSLLSLTFCLVVVLYLFVLVLIRRSHAKPARDLQNQIDLNDLIDGLEAGKPVTDLIEQILGRTDLSLSASLRAALEAALYANSIEERQLLQLLRREATL